MQLETRSRPGGRSQAAEISSANQIDSQDATPDAVVRCIRCRRELTAERSIRHQAGRQCRHLFAMEVAA